MSPLTVEIPDALVDAITEGLIARLTPLLASNQGVNDAFLNVEQAAAFIGDAPTSRIYDLVAQRKLTPCRDGRRLLFDQADLRAYLKGTA